MKGGKKRKLDQRVKKLVASNQIWTCACCNETLSSTYEVDHKVALMNGGSDALENLQALCRECHGLKTNYEQLIAQRKLKVKEDRQGSAQGEKQQTIKYTIKSRCATRRKTQCDNKRKEAGVQARDTTFLETTSTTSSDSLLLACSSSSSSLLETFYIYAQRIFEGVANHSIGSRTCKGCTRGVVISNNMLRLPWIFKTTYGIGTIVPNDFCSIPCLEQFASKHVSTLNLKQWVSHLQRVFHVLHPPHEWSISVMHEEWGAFQIIFTSERRLNGLYPSFPSQASSFLQLDPYKHPDIY
jgi:hypothetical protein